MATQHVVELKLVRTGTVLDVWDRYTVVQDILQPGSPFTFSLWRSQVANASWEVINDEVKCFEQIQLRIDGALQMSGTIERVQPMRERKRGAGIVISGTDLTGRLQRFDASPRVSSRNTTLAELISALVDPFNVSVVIGDAGSMRDVQLGRQRAHVATSSRPRRNRITLEHPRMGEKVWGVIQRLCAKVGYYAWVAPAGPDNLILVIDNPVGDQDGGDIEYTFEYAEDREYVTGRTLLESDLTISVSDMPTNVYAYGRTLRGDGTPARQCGHAEGVFDRRWVMEAPQPHQPVHFQPETTHTPAATLAAAVKIIHTAAINHKVATGTVQGHSQDGKIFAINTLCRWKDEVADLDEDMVLTRVEFVGSRADGSTTQLRVHPRGALNLQPEQR